MSAIRLPAPKADSPDAAPIATSGLLLGESSSWRGRAAQNTRLSCRTSEGVTSRLGGEADLPASLFISPEQRNCLRDETTLYR